MTTDNHQFIRISIIILLIVGLWALWMKLQKPNVFPIATVKVVSSYNHVTHATLKDTAMPYVYTGFFALDATELRKHLTKLPWVADATVSRVWPDTVIMRVIEHRPAAQWQNEGIVNTQGEVIYPDITRLHLNIPIFVGPPGQAKHMLLVHNTFSKMLDVLGLHITELYLTERHSWWLILNNGVTVKLGRSNIDERVDRFIKSYPHIFDVKGTGVESVDLRYPNGLAVKWKQR